MVAILAAPAQYADAKAVKVVTNKAAQIIFAVVAAAVRAVAIATQAQKLYHFNRAWHVVAKDHNGKVGKLAVIKELMQPPVANAAVVRLYVMVVGEVFHKLWLIDQPSGLVHKGRPLNG